MMNDLKTALYSAPSFTDRFYVDDEVVKMKAALLPEDLRVKYLHMTRECERMVFAVVHRGEDFMRFRISSTDYSTEVEKKKTAAMRAIYRVHKDWNLFTAKSDGSLGWLKGEIREFKKHVDRLYELATKLRYKRNEPAFSFLKFAEETEKAEAEHEEFRRRLRKENEAEKSKKEANANAISASEIVSAMKEIAELKATIEKLTENCKNVKSISELEDEDA